MQFNSSVIRSICESALFYKVAFYNPLDLDAVSLCRNIDAFVQALSSHSLPGLTRGQLENCCLFLSFFVENAPDGVNTAAHRALLVQFSQILRTQP